MSVLFISSMMVFQGVLMAIDEFVFHWKRGLPKWERLGHPLDTLTVFIPVAIALFSLPTEGMQRLFFGCAIVSSLSVTKDEWVHSRECTPEEQWLHALLFILHPISFWLVWELWVAQTPPTQFLLGVYLVSMGVFGLYQLVYWNGVYANQQRLLS